MTADLSSLTAESSSRRAALVERLETEGVLTDPRVREALLRVRREVLLPHAYLRVSGPAADPIDWRLLDGSHPDDREEWLDLVHEGDSVLLQRDGEPLDALGRGPVTGGHMTSMSSGLPLTVEGLQTLQLAAAQSFLDLGTGSGISLALAATITGPGCATGVERDPHMAAFTQRNLDRLAFGVQVVTGDALDGHPASAPYDRVHSGFGVPCVPPAWVEQLAPGGRLLTTLTTATPSWPGQLLITLTPQDRIEAVLRGGVRGTRPLLGYQWLTAVHHRSRIDADPGRPRATRLAPPDRTSHGFWLAASHLAPGLMWDIPDETMRIVAPDDDSWAVPGPEEGTVRVHGPRDVWAELEALHDRWERAGRPDTYRVDIPGGGGPQHVTSGDGPSALEWALPPLAALPRQAASTAPPHQSDSEL
ncbi:methyltransferase domain-containing protein [Streptomyces sp. NPDC056169]|uniref:methyltransferase domain-containing protein n=1 Tax=Streptomyces sp. NPDC056169 TaxID=3345734 RepID=UPI0035E0721F